MNDVDILIRSAEALFAADSRVFSQVARIQESLSVLEDMAEDNSGRGLCASIALAVVSRRAKRARDRHFENFMTNLRKVVGNAPDCQKHTRCKWRRSTDTGGEICMQDAEPGGLLCHSHQAVVDQEIQEGKRNAEGRTPEEESESRIKAGRCGECGSTVGHYRDCSRHRNNK